VLNLPERKQASNLERVTQRELDEAIRKHGVFVKGVRGGARAVFKFKDMSHLDFRKSDLSQADFTGSVLVGANLAEGIFRGVSFFSCDLRNAALEKGDFSRADFRGAFVAGANLTGAVLAGADLREGKVMEKERGKALQDRQRQDIPDKVHKTIFTGAKLSETNLSGARAAAADFSDADLSGVIVKDADFSSANFEGANLSQADFTGTDLSNANVHSSIMTGTVLEHTETGGANLKEALAEKAMGSSFEDLKKSMDDLLKDHTTWIATAGKAGARMDLSGLDMRQIEKLGRYPLTAVKAVGTTFLNQDLSGAEIQSAILDRADFRDCKLTKTDLRGSSLKNAMLSRADLSEARLSSLQFTNQDGSPRLQRVNLSHANLRYAILRGADLRDAILTGVDLSYAILIDCDLRRADLTGALLYNADLTGALLNDTLIDDRYRELALQKTT
jgi:uncharacterized protein YjbI with pentapeptide repeats